MLETGPELPQGMRFFKGKKHFVGEMYDKDVRCNSKKEKYET